MDALAVHPVAPPMAALALGEAVSSPPARRRRNGRLDAALRVLFKPSIQIFGAVLGGTQIIRSTETIDISREDKEHLKIYARATLFQRVKNSR